MRSFASFIRDFIKWQTQELPPMQVPIYEPPADIRPNPMPSVRAALIPLVDAGEAVVRGTKAWRPAQVIDAIQCARRWLDEAEAALTAAGASQNGDGGGGGAS